VAYREVLGHVQCQRRLPHRRPRGDDDQVPGLEAGRELVELLEAGGTAGDVGTGLVQVHDPLEALLQQPFDVAEVTRDPLLGEIEDDLLGAVDEVCGLAGPVLPEPCDLGSRTDEPAKCRHLPHDPRVVSSVRGRGDERGELMDAGAAAHLLELPALLERVDEGNGVDWLPLLVQRKAGTEDDPVALAVEVGRREDLGDRPDRARRDQHRAQHRLLGLEVLRRDVR
jgi:hypothetical protein